MEEYTLFVRYRDMGGMAGFQDMLTVTGQSNDYVFELSRRWRWDDRVKAYRRTMEVILSEHYAMSVKGTQKELVGILGEALRLRMGKIFKKIVEEEGEQSLQAMLKETKDLALILEKISSKIARDGEHKQVKPINIVFMPNSKITDTLEVKVENVEDDPV
jgi:hypothetical protein